MAEQEAQNGVSENAVSAPRVLAAKTLLRVEAPKANEAVLFYKAAFGAEEIGRTLNQKRKAEHELPLVAFAEIKIRGASFLIADFDASFSPLKKDGENFIVFILEVEDVESAVAKASSAGPVTVGEVVEGEGVFCGGRVGKMLKDPYGFDWFICSPVKGADVEA